MRLIVSWIQLPWLTDIFPSSGDIFLKLSLEERNRREKIFSSYAKKSHVGQNFFFGNATFYWEIILRRVLTIILNNRCAEINIRRVLELWSFNFEIFLIISLYRSKISFPSIYIHWYMSPIQFNAKSERPCQKRMLWQSYSQWFVIAFREVTINIYNKIRCIFWVDFNSDD